MYILFLFMHTHTYNYVYEELKSDYDHGQKNLYSDLKHPNACI